MSSISKEFEKLLQKRLIKFCDKNNNLTSNQFGFRIKRTCADVSLAITEFIRTKIENETSRQVCFIDLQKSVWTLHHEIILNKLENYGFWGTVLKLLRDYLRDRWQFVSINDKSTSLGKIETGVPQGSVLGPLFFLLYISDLELAMQKCQITMFADETAIYHGKSLPSQSLQVDKIRAMKWFYANKLTVNATKCERISFGTGKHTAIWMKQRIIANKKSCKYLGLRLGGRVNFVHHIEFVLEKSSKVCGSI